MYFSFAQSGSPSCPAQLAQIPAAPHLALVEDVAEGQAPPQRHPRRGWARGKYLSTLTNSYLINMMKHLWPNKINSQRESGTKIVLTAPTWRLRDTAAPAASISGILPTLRTRAFS